MSEPMTNEWLLEWLDNDGNFRAVNRLFNAQFNRRARKAMRALIEHGPEVSREWLETKQWDWPHSVEAQLDRLVEILQEAGVKVKEPADE